MVVDSRRLSVENINNNANRQIVPLNVDSLSLATHRYADCKANL